MTREEARASIKEHLDLMYPFNTPKDVLKVAYEALGQPDIVRCKDCVNCIKEPNGDLYCDVLAIGYEPLCSKRVTENWFCADGERKEGR